MKLKYNKAYIVAAGVAGTVICKKCRHTFPAFRNDGANVFCPECDTEQKNPFYCKSKERKSVLP